MTITHFSVKEGLSNNTVSSLFLSKKGDLWIGTSNGLNKLDKEVLTSRDGLRHNSSPLIKTYNNEDGFSGVGLNFGNTIFEGSDGTFWLGADDRLLAFRPGQLTMDTSALNVQLTGIALFNERIKWQTLTDQKFESVEDRLGNYDPYLTTQIREREQEWKAIDTSFVLGNGVRVHDIHFDSLSKWYALPENLSLAYDNNDITFQYVGITTQSPQKVKYQY